jgi:hypothetical protein
VQCLRPASANVKQLLMCALQEVTDYLLGDAISKVCVYATEDKLLALFVTGLFECVVGKLPVVAMVMLNLYAILGGKGLEGAFGGNGLNRRIIGLKVNKAEVAVVVNKDSCTPVPPFGEFPFHLRVEPNLSQRHLVNKDTLPRLGSDKDLVRSLGFPAVPWGPCHCAKETSIALGWLDIHQLLGGFPVEGKLLQLDKR